MVIVIKSILKIKYQTTIFAIVVYIHRRKDDQNNMTIHKIGLKKEY